MNTNPPPAPDARHHPKRQIKININKNIRDGQEGTTHGSVTHTHLALPPILRTPKQINKHATTVRDSK